MLELLVFVLLLVLTAEFVNGWTDAPNAIATVVSTNTLPPRFAVPMAVILNAAGAMAGTAVAATIGKGIVATEAINLASIAAAMVSIIAWGGFAAWRGIPISKSHALIAGLAGAGLAGGGFEALLFEGWVKVGIGIASSIGAGFILSFLFGRGIIAFAGRASPARAHFVFNLLHIGGAASMAFAHGMNDGQKFIGIFALVLVLGGASASFYIPFWVILLCAATMGLGTALGGWRIVATVGKKMVSLQSWQGCSATMMASATIIAASHYGVPLSTTHTITAAIAGASSSRRISDVRWQVLGRIMQAWIITFPCCGALAFVAALATNYLF